MGHYTSHMATCRASFPPHPLPVFSKSSTLTLYARATRFFTDSTLSAVSSRLAAVRSRSYFLCRDPYHRPVAAPLKVAELCLVPRRFRKFCLSSLSWNTCRPAFPRHMTWYQRPAPSILNGRAMAPVYHSSFSLSMAMR